MYPKKLTYIQGQGDDWNKILDVLRLRQWQGAEMKGDCTRCRHPHPSLCIREV